MTARPCRDVHDELAWFVGGDLPVERERAVADHLRDCTACRREAAALQQSGKALGAAGRVVPEGADEAMFTVLHAAIVDAVNREGMDRASGELARTWMPRWLSRRWLQALAAAALFLSGWWLVDAGTAVSLLDRPPLGTANAAGGSAKAVPFAGDRVQLQPLGDEWKPGEEAENGNGIGRGMMGRRTLRTLEDGALVVPVHR